VVAQKERWRAPGGGGIGGGTVTTAGNLVFQVIPDGRFVAYTADKGEKVLEVQTGLRGGMGPPITYMLDGKQYVALMGGLGALPTFGPPGGGAGGGGRGAAPAPAAGAAAPAPPPAPPAIPPAPPATPIMPKLLVFVLDGKTPVPGVAAQ
jgi:quinohemoprotein ethanol dehydrogenase